MALIVSLVLARLAKPDMVSSAVVHVGFSILREDFTTCFESTRVNFDHHRGFLSVRGRGGSNHVIYYLLQLDATYKYWNIYVPTRPIPLVTSYFCLSSLLAWHTSTTSGLSYVF